MFIVNYERLLNVGKFCLDRLVTSTNYGLGRERLHCSARCLYDYIFVIDVSRDREFLSSRREEISSHRN